MLAVNPNVFLLFLIATVGCYFGGRHFDTAFGPSSGHATVEVELSDRIYDPTDLLGASPIVLESHKLVFFPASKVGSTSWLKLFRRMMGYKDWRTANPHVGTAGLVRLKDLDLHQASRIMNSPEYTKAVFVRDPKERFLSVWFDKINQYDESIQQNCCHEQQDCLEEAQTLSGFVELATTCVDRHWIPQSKLIDNKYLSKLDFIGHSENIASDARQLLEKIGAWKEFGESGWGKHGDESLFESTSAEEYSTDKRTGEYWDYFSEIFTPETEAAVESLYAEDYNTKELDIDKKKIDFTRDAYKWKDQAILSSSYEPHAFEDVHILLFETNTSVIDEPHSSLKLFLDTSDAAGIKTTVFGNGITYQGFGDKFVHARKNLESIGQDSLVVLADARDVILNIPNQAAASSIVTGAISSFKKLTGNNQEAVVVSAEAQCCVAALSHASPEDYFDSSGTRNNRACPSGRDGCMYVGNINIHRWKTHMTELALTMTGKIPENAYLNAGLIAGSPKALISLIDQMDLRGYEDDQAVMSGLLFREPTKLILDYEQELFGNTQWTKGLERGCVYHINEDGLLTHDKTAQTPLVVHAAGKFYTCLDQMIENLGQVSQKRFLQVDDDPPLNYVVSPFQDTVPPNATDNPTNFTSDFPSDFPTSFPETESPTLSPTVLAVDVLTEEECPCPSGLGLFTSHTKADMCLPACPPGTFSALRSFLTRSTGGPKCVPSEIVCP